ncbi:MAG: pyrroloquinoline-quinone synthase PqqC [Candidatus Competibacterales bacterium]
MSLDPWSPAEFEARLRALGRLYHIHHPFQVLMVEGKLNRQQIQGWVANRFYYQLTIPRKDAALLANCSDRSVRRQWIQRIVDHDGQGADDGGDGGIEAWLALGRAVGLSREALLCQQHVLPGVRFAVDAYLNFVRRAPWQEGVCSSLTELFAPTIHRQRLASWPDKYPWIDPEGLAYFRNRLGEAHRDVQHGLAVTLAHFQSRDQQERALEIVRFKLEVLWSMLDAMYLAYIHEMPPFFTAAPEETPP